MLCFMPFDRMGYLSADKRIYFLLDFKQINVFSTFKWILEAYYHKGKCETQTIVICDISFGIFPMNIKDSFKNYLCYIHLTLVNIFRHFFILLQKCWKRMLDVIGKYIFEYMLGKLFYPIGVFFNSSL